MQWSMDNLKSTFCPWGVGTRHLVDAVLRETLRIKPLIFESTSWAMLKNLFQAIETLFRATIYLLILLMSLSIAGLGAFVILFLAIRIGQFIWTLVLAEKWL